jgi:hypothetical protein
MASRRVVFPAPLPPRMATSSPGSTVNDTALRIRLPPFNRLERPATSIRKPGTSSRPRASGPPSGPGLAASRATSRAGLARRTSSRSATEMAHSWVGSSAWIVARYEVSPARAASPTDWPDPKYQASRSPAMVPLRRPDSIT